MDSPIGIRRLHQRSLHGRNRGRWTDFYQAYRSQIPPVEPIRGTIYNLYHLLNHFNLFGGSYASQVDSSIQKILSNV
ncbi:MAG: hypothetical protein CMO61_01465 [Verrucomicrobiales bacterium]|nr:hypothetical protein [Verrucomicrobiales bacterium]